eukprot:20214_1
MQSIDLLNMNSFGSEYFIHPTTYTNDNASNNSVRRIFGPALSHNFNNNPSNNSHKHNKKRHLNVINLIDSPPKKKVKHCNTDETHEQMKTYANLMIQLNKQSIDDYQILQKESKEDKQKFNSLQKKFNSLEKKHNSLQKDMEEVDSAYNESKNKIHELKNKNGELEIDNKKLEERIEGLIEKINVYNGTSKIMGRYNMKELIDLKNELKNGIKNIEESEQTLLENKYKCISCYENDKNIIFIDGCNHNVFCMECEQKWNPKRCPRCDTQYTNVRKYI